jgi:acyl-CoA synthetase (AMP-forming)/AMP-acid ligase II
MSTFYQQLTANGDSHHRAIVVPNRSIDLNYPQLISAIKSFQYQLAQLGLAHQSAVSISLPNSIEFAVGFLAVTSSSLIAAPLNPNYKQSEFAFYIEDVKSELVIVPQGAVKSNYPAVLAARQFNAAVAEVWWDSSSSKILFDLKEPGKLKTTGAGQIPPPPSPKETAFVLHTSGTTGRPKAVPLTHANMAATVSNIINTYKLVPSDTSYLVMPLFHVHGLLCGFLGPLGSGGSVIMPATFSAHAFWKEYVQYGANWYTAVPTIHQILLKSEKPVPVPYIRFIRSCSSPLAPTTFHDLEANFHAPVLEAYAMTEACHQMASNNLPPGKRKPGTVGQGQGVEVVILDGHANFVPKGKEGEICIRGPNVTPGYINNPKANAESFTKNGYFRTGDQGKLDDDGFVVITGRIKELIIRGGENISPVELDGVMLEHPAVAEAVSFGAPDEMYGQQVNAAIVLKNGHENTTEKDIQQFLSTKLSNFKIPRRIFFTKVMPKTATGKIQRRIIAAEFLDKNKNKNNIRAKL